MRHPCPRLALVILDREASLVHARRAVLSARLGDDLAGVPELQGRGSEGGAAPDPGRERAGGRRRPGARGGLSRARIGRDSSAADCADARAWIRRERCPMRSTLLPYEVSLEHLQ